MLWIQKAGGNWVSENLQRSQDKFLRSSLPYTHSHINTKHTDIHANMHRNMHHRASGHTHAHVHTQTNRHAGALWNALISAILTSELQD